MSQAQGKEKTFEGQKNSGQVVVEYVLLLVIGVAMALLITRAMVYRGGQPDERGFLIQKWKLIIDGIGQDKADDINR